MVWLPRERKVKEDTVMPYERIHGNPCLVADESTAAKIKKMKQNKENEKKQKRKKRKEKKKSRLKTGPYVLGSLALV